MQTKQVEGFGQVDFSGMKMPMIVIYNSPQDCPGKYIARVWEAAIPAATNCIQIRDNLDELRMDIRAAGFITRFPRAAGDDPVIVESWMR